MSNIDTTDLSEISSKPDNDNNNDINNDNDKLQVSIDIGSGVDEDQVLDLLTNCSFNNISTRSGDNTVSIANANGNDNGADNTIDSAPNEELFDYSSEDEVEYGDEETILSMTTSRRSMLESTRVLLDSADPLATSTDTSAITGTGASGDIPPMSPSANTIIPLLPTNPPPMDEKYWCEPDGETFFVRSKSYMTNRKKVSSGPSLFRLFAVDMVKIKNSEKSSSSTGPILTGVCSHPDERIQKCLAAQAAGEPGSDLPPFVFCVNIYTPGKPAFHAAFYYAVDDYSLIDPKALDPESGVTSPNPEFTKVASKFFFGSSDKYRDMTFKLIPRIAKGNFVVKKAVGSKPTLLGTKLKQHYIMNERFMEIVIDVGSDKIAKKVVGLSRGYAETLVVDMAFVLEGKGASTLPEQVLGTIRLSNLDFNANYRTISHPSTS